MAPADHVGIAPTIVAIVAAALGAISLAAIAGALAVAAVLLAVIAYCRWWLYDRLVCLGGDRCAIGMLLTVEPPENKSGWIVLTRTTASTSCLRRIAWATAARPSKPMAFKVT